MPDGSDFWGDTGDWLNGVFGRLGAATSNPSMLPALGALQGLGAASAPSRLPVTNGMMWGSLAGGLRQGIAAGQQSRLTQQEAQQHDIANMMAMAHLRFQAGRHPEMFPPGTIDQMSTRLGLPGSLAGPAPAVAPIAQAQGPLGASGTGSAPAAAGAAAPAQAPTPAGAPMLGGLFTPQQEGDILDAQLMGVPSEVIAKQLPGPTDIATLYREMNALPPNDPRRPIYNRAILEKIGVKPENIRQGGSYFDPVTGKFVHNPVLGTGVTLDDSGNAQIVPGALGAESAVHGAIAGAEAGAKARFEQMEVVDPNTGAHYFVPKTALQTSPSPLMAALGPEKQANLAAKGAAEFEPLAGTTDASGNALVRNRLALANPPASAPIPVGSGGLVTGADPAFARTAAAAPAAAAPAIASGAPSVAAASPAATPAPAAAAPAAGPTVPTAAGPKPLGDLKLGDVLQGVTLPTRPAPPAGTMYGELNDTQKKLQTEDGERLATYNKEAAGGQKIYQDLSMLSGVLDRGLNTNNLAPLWTDLTNVAQGLGATGIIPKDYDPNDAALFNKVSTDLVFAALKQLPGQPRVTEITGLQKANPNMVIPRATNAEMLHGILANQQWLDKRSELGTDFVISHPGVPLGTFDAAYNAKVPLVDITKGVFDVARAQGWKFPGDEGAGNSPNSQPKVIAPENIAKATQLRSLYRAMPPEQQKAQRSSFEQQLRALGFE